MEHALLFLTAISSVHNGAGVGLGMIDRPIIRERTTNFPIIQGSTLKGALRDEYESKIGTDMVNWLFGPMDDGSKHAGCISFSDASIFAFPVRSLKGSFVWATSPLILYRFQRAVGLARLIDLFPNLGTLIADRRLHSKAIEVFINNDAEDDLLIKGSGNSPKGKIILEEFPLGASPLEALPAFASEAGEFIFGGNKPPSNTDGTPHQKSLGAFKDLGKALGLGSEESFKEEFERKLVVIPQDMFNYFVTYATEVVPNIRIDGDTGTTKIGSLRYTEYLPGETILYSIVSFERPFAKEVRDDEKFNEPAKVRDFIIENKPKDVIQVGGDETKGKGFLNMSFVSKEVKG